MNKRRRRIAKRRRFQKKVVERYGVEAKVDGRTEVDMDETLAAWMADDPTRTDKEPGRQRTLDRFHG
jgi:hypothetical protein